MCGVRLMMNFDTETWMGPQSEHLSKKKEGLIAVRDDETEPNVVRWIDLYIEYLDAGMVRARVEEERSDF